MKYLVTMLCVVFALSGCLSTGSQAKLTQAIRDVCQSGAEYHQAYAIWKDQGLIPARYVPKAELAWNNFDRFCATPQNWTSKVAAATTAAALFYQIQAIVRDAKAAR